MIGLRLVLSRVCYYLTAPFRFIIEQVILGWKAFVVVFGCLGLLLVSSYSYPLLDAYPVTLSSDISAILVKTSTRTVLDVLPEYASSKVKVDPSVSPNLLQKQAMLNAYGAALNMLNIKTTPGLLVLESEIYDKGTIINYPLKKGTSFLKAKLKVNNSPIENSSISKVVFEEEIPVEQYIYLNNTTYPTIPVPSILALANGNSDTLALTLYFLEEITGGNWNNEYQIKLTGALSNPMDNSSITPIGSVDKKAAINLDNSILLIPRANKKELAAHEIQKNTYFVSDLYDVVNILCSLPHKGTLCNNHQILRYLKNPQNFKPTDSLGN